MSRFIVDARCMLTSWGERELAALGQIALSFSELEGCAERLLAGLVIDDVVATLLVTG